MNSNAVAVSEARLAGAGPGFASAPAEPVRLTDEEQWVWRAFMATHRRLLETLERQLQVVAGLGIQDFLILSMLAEAPQQRMRMTELAFMSHGSSSRTSHAVDRLEHRGWVQRARTNEDGRGSVAVLTVDGLERVHMATPAQVEVMRTYLFDLVSHDELAVLGRVMFAVMAAFDEANRPR
ncbi:MAG: MarR family transcriptional regulator [Micrococcales bacterium]|nr:MAG: MarR family transcriptional regulator [Micrococcales bacterium]